MNRNKHMQNLVNLVNPVRKYLDRINMIYRIKYTDGMAEFTKSEKLSFWEENN